MANNEPGEEHELHGKESIFYAKCDGKSLGEMPEMEG